MRGDFTWDVMKKETEGLARRFDTVAENLSNGNTPRYARKETSFEDQLRDVIEGPRRLPLAVTNSQHIPTGPRTADEVKPADHRIYDEVYRLDGNNVDPERENALLAQTRMQALAVNRLIAKKAGIYRLVIGGR